jgi:hypothetical protein
VIGQPHRHHRHTETMPKIMPASCAGVDALPCPCSHQSISHTTPTLLLCPLPYITVSHQELKLLQLFVDLFL